MTPNYPEFVDSSSIDDDAVVYRRVDWDKVGGRERATIGASPRLNGNCFTDFPEARATAVGYPGPCMSVGLSTILADLRLTPEAMLIGFDGYGLASIRVGDLRQLKKGNGDPGPQGIMMSPTTTEPWHCVVFDLQERPRKEGCKKAIAKVAEWNVPLVG